MQMSPAISSAFSAISWALISVFSSSARAAAWAKAPPEPMAIRPCSGSITSPLPVIISDAVLSATASKASSLRRARSLRQSLASSTAARVRLPWCFSSWASKRSKRVKASAVPPANPAITWPLYKRRTLRAFPFMTVLPRETWPSPPMATSSSRRTETMVVILAPVACVKNRISGLWRQLAGIQVAQVWRLWSRGEGQVWGRLSKNRSLRHIPVALLLRHPWLRKFLEGHPQPDTNLALAPTYGTVWIFYEFHFSPFHLPCIQNQQAADKGFADFRDHLYCLHGLSRTDHSDQRSDDTGFRASQVFVALLRIETVVTRASRLAGVVNGELAFATDGCTGDKRDTRSYRSSIQREASVEVIGAIQHQGGFGDQLFEIVCIHPAIHRINSNLRVNRPHPLCQTLSF